jgi:hypothetical protein
LPNLIEIIRRTSLLPRNLRRNSSWKPAAIYTLCSLKPKSLLKNQEPSPKFQGAVC